MIRKIALCLLVAAPLSAPAVAAPGDPSQQVRSLEAATRLTPRDGGNFIEISQNLQSGASPDGGLTKSGAGTLVLSGSNTYNGGTTVLDGKLVVTNAWGLADGSSLTVGDPSAFASPVVPSTAGAGAAAAMPEPGSLALLAAVATAGWAVWRRRKGKN